MSSAVAPVVSQVQWLADLAKATHGTFYLLGRTILPGKDDADILKLKNDRNAFKSELHKRLTATGEKVTPVQLEQKLSAIERGASMLDLQASVEAVGGKAVYITCDVTDAKSVGSVIDTNRQLREGRGLFHSRRWSRDKPEDRK